MKDSVRDLIRDEIARLSAMSTQELTALLLVESCKGTPRMCTTCPLARYFVKFLRKHGLSVYAIRFYGDELSVTIDEPGGMWELFETDGLDRFTYMFDRGDIPQLVAD